MVRIYKIFFHHLFQGVNLIRSNCLVRSLTCFASQKSPSIIKPLHLPALVGVQTSHVPTIALAARDGCFAIVPLNDMAPSIDLTPTKQPPTPPKPVTDSLPSASRDWLEYDRSMIFPSSIPNGTTRAWISRSLVFFFREASLMLFFAPSPVFWPKKAQLYTFILLYTPRGVCSGTKKCAEEKL